jgi:peptidoglycan/LPS O-acetylase OafA/YrhL
VLIAVLPLGIALGRYRLSLIPVIAALIATTALPFCQTQASLTYWNGTANATYTHSTPSLIAHAVVAALAGFLAWWGVRQSSKALVNYGIVAFAVSIIWFTYADIFSKLGRSVSLIALGILFVGGGWALEKTRRKLISAMPQKEAA